MPRTDRLLSRSAPLFLEQKTVDSSHAKPEPTSLYAAASLYRLSRDGLPAKEQSTIAMKSLGKSRVGWVDGGNLTKAESNMRRMEAANSECYDEADATTSLPKRSYFYRPCSPSLSLCHMVLLLVAALLLRPISAARVAFDNCLPDNYVFNTNPVLLQWVPLFVDASFDTQHPNHTLRVTMYGNVTGVYTNASLPPPDSKDWQDANKTDGKLLREPHPESDNPKLTTLHSKVDFLSYEPWNTDSDFCDQSLANAKCPLAPVFNTSVPWQELPSATMSHDFYSSYSFTSFSATFIIKYGDDAVTTVGCVSATVTPDLGNLAWMLKFLPLVVLLGVGFATLFAGIYSPWGTTDIFHWSSNYGRDADLLRLVTPGFGDCLQYIQFVALTGGLTLNYPGFYQPIVSQASWSALMFNESFVSKEPGRQSLIDGIYVTDGLYGLQDLAQLVGMGQVQDIWAGMMIWLLVIIASVTVLCQIGFGVQWIYRYIKKIPEEDLRAKNFPFSAGNVIRIVFNYFLLPIVALSTFQLVSAGSSPVYTVALAVLTLVLIIGFAIWLLYLIISTRPRAVLFDDLPSVLLYGPLYNTYSDEAAAFALIPILMTFLRGIAIGAVQPIGIAQVILLAICEVIQILTLHAFRPFHSQSSMNAYHTLFSALRLISILLMIAFIPTLGVTEGPKGWIGYVILLIHAGVLVLGFLLNAVKTILEVMARMAGAGGDDVRGQTRGGLSKIFGMRQLSRRMPRRGAPSRQSQLSSTAILDAEEASKSGYIMPSGRVRSESAGSMGVLLNNRGKRTSSAMDNNSVDLPFAPGRHLDSGASSFGPMTPGEISNFSFLPSPNLGRKTASAGGIEGGGEFFYRPPRKARRPTSDRDNMSSPAERTRGSWASNDWLSQRHVSSAGGALGDPPEIDGQISRGPTPAPHGQVPENLAPRADYATREVDLYYGGRGPRLNTDGPSRKMGTGPADPTGPMASAAGWFRTMFGGKTKEKGKGFEVVRSSRMPPAMRARGDDLESAPPEGIPVAMGVLRNGPIESDDEDETKRTKRQANNEPGEAELLDADGNPRNESAEEHEITRVSDVPPMLPGIDYGESIRMPSRIQSKASRHAPRRETDSDDSDNSLPPVPDLPRKSSRRASNSPSHSRGPSVIQLSSIEDYAPSSGQHLAPPATSSRLPFERSNSQKRLSSASSMEGAESFEHVDLREESPNGPAIHEDRPTSFGYVQKGSISRVDPDHRRQVDLLGSSAEVVDARK